MARKRQGNRAFLPLQNCQKLACFHWFGPEIALYWCIVLTLSLDTSSLVGSLAVTRDDQLLGVISTRSAENYSSRMFRHLEFLLHDLSLKLADFDLFSVAAGPGSFTGLRVGLTAAKAWAEVYQKPVVGVSVLEAAAAQSFQQHAPREALIIPILDARRRQIYCAFYRQTDSRLILEGKELVLSPEELLDEILKRASNSAAVVATAEPELISTALSRFENSKSSQPTTPIILHIVSGVLAPWIGRLGIASAKRGEFSDALTLDANYVRRSDAELQLKGK
jgi:tRNA threonylcarbamoyladenosine biosynthesis protein TsaB